MIKSRDWNKSYTAFHYKSSFAAATKKYNKNKKKRLISVVIDYNFTE